MLHVGQGFLSGSSTSKDEALLDCLQNIKYELRAIHAKLDSVDRASQNNEQRLELIDGLLRSHRPEDKRSQPPTVQNLSLPCRTAVVALCSLALLSRRLRRALRRLPVGVLLLLQAAAASAIIALRGLDAICVRNVAEEQTRRRHRAAACKLLVGSSIAIPLKGVAHMLN